MSSACCLEESSTQRHIPEERKASLLQLVFILGIEFGKCTNV